MKRLIIIGGGPIGLYLAKKLEENNLSYLLLEAGEVLGGQLISIYPEKVIEDLKECAPLLAKHYVESLVKQVNLENVLFNEEVISINPQDNHVEVISKNGHKYLSEYVVIATGLGFYQPRPLGLDNEHLYDNILYYLKDYKFLQDKRVAVFGGGDSALDWAKQISEVAKQIYLIHRRNEFRGNVETIKNLTSLIIKTPFIPESLIVKDKKLIGVKIKNVNDESILDLEVDYLFVNFGSLPTKVSFDVLTTNKGVLCDEFRCVKNRIYVAGDAIGNEGKIKRIEDGYKDVRLILKSLFNV